MWGLWDNYGPTGLGFAVLIIGGLAAFLLLAAVIVTSLSIGQCATFGREYGLPHHWTPFYGCFLKLPDGHWIVSGQYHAFQTVHR